MNKVTTIHVSGRAYQLEESGYEQLRRYLDAAAAALAENPDKDEIMGDLEAAIAEKCQSALSPHKSVVTTADVERIIAEMGPVAGASKENAGAKEPKPGAPKRLYQIREGAWITGVCQGLAAYFDIDVTIVRVLFALFTILTHGAGIGLYFVMMVFIPVARTPEEHARAAGVAPITAQELINRAKEGYEHVKNSRDWRAWKYRMKHDAHQWKRRLRADRRRNYGNYYDRYYGKPYSPFWEFMHAMLGMVWFLIIIGLGVLAYQHVGWVHDLFNQVPVWIQHDAESIRAWWQSRH